MRRFVERPVKMIWRVVIFIVGLVLFVAGVIMIVTPGPAVVFIPLGLAVWATEFEWARRLLEKLRPMIDAAVAKAKDVKRNRRARREEKRAARQKAMLSTQHASPPGAQS